MLTAMRNARIPIEYLLLLFLVSCSTEIEQYDLIQSEGVSVVEAKNNSHEVTKFSARGQPGVFSVHVDRSTGSVTLHVEGSGLFISCDTASIQYKGKSYKAVSKPTYSDKLVQPVKCRQGQIVDTSQTDVPHTYLGIGAVEFILPTPMNEPIELALPSVRASKASIGASASSVTVTYKTKKFPGGGGWH